MRRRALIATALMGMVLACAFASILLGRAAGAEPTACQARSTDGCLCVEEALVTEWRTKALASDIFWEKGGCPESPGVVATTGSCGLGSAAVFGIIEVIKAVR